MDLKLGREIVLRLLRAKGKAKNSEMLQALGDDSSLLQQIREDLLFNDLAEDKKDVGLIYTGPPVQPASPDSPAAAAPAGPREAISAPASAQPQPPAPLRIFLSYGHDTNEELVRRIKADLEKRGHDVWFDKSEIKTGDEWRHAITDGILKSNRVVSFLSKHSTRDPGVCLDEISIAIGFKGGNILTVLVESERDVEPPPTVSHIQWLDMHDWREHQATGGAGWSEYYQEKLGEIVRAVESDESRRLAGEIETLKRYLKPISSDSRLSTLLQKGFVGRCWMFAEIEQWRNTAERDSRLFWIVGDPGVGKSALAANLTHFGRGKVIAAEFVQWHNRDHRDVRKVVCTIAFQLATQLRDYRRLLLTLPEIDNLEGKGPAELFDYLLATPLCHTIDAGRERHLIIIDAIDEAAEGQENPLVDLLARYAERLPDWLGIVVTSRPENAVTGPLQALAPVVMDTATAANRADLRDYLHHELAPQLKGRADADHLVEQILDRSEGVFLYVERFCEDVHHKHLSLEHPEQFPQGLGGTYFQWFQRQFPDLERFRKNVRAALRVILAACEPLPVALLGKLFHWQKDELGDFTRMLGSLFPVVGERGEQVIKAYHRSVVDWLGDEAKAGPYFASIDEGHGALADTCWADYRQGVPSLSRYALAHLPTHLVAVKRWDDVCSLLCDLKFIQARIDAGLVFELADDIAKVFRSLPAGDHRRRVLAMLEVNGRSEMPAMGRMVIRSLAAIAEHDPAGASKVLTALVAPGRTPDASTAQAKVQAARVALEVAMATCRLESMGEAVRHVLLTASADADTNVRSLAVVSVFQLVRGNPDLGMGVLQELAGRSVRFGLVRPQKLGVFAGAAIGVFYENAQDKELTRKLKLMARSVANRIWGVRLALWLAPRVAAPIWNSVPDDTNNINPAEFKAYKGYAPQHPDLIAAVSEMIDFMDPGHGTGAEFAAAVSRLDAKIVCPEALLAYLPAQQAIISRALAGEESALDAAFDSWLHASLWGTRQDFMYRLRIVQVGLEVAGRPPLEEIWTQRMETAIRTFLYEQHGTYEGAYHAYVSGSLVTALAFIAHQRHNGRLALLQELVDWAAAGLGGMLRWPQTPPEQQADAVLLRVLEVLGVETGLFDPLARKVAFFGIRCFLEHAAKFDAPSPDKSNSQWDRMAVILARMNIYHSADVARFLDEIAAEHRKELQDRMNKVLPKEGVGTLVSPHHAEVFYCCVFAEPPGKRDGLRGIWQDCLREFLGPKSLPATLRYGIHRLYNVIQTDSPTSPQ